MFNKRHIVRTIAATVSILALSFTAGRHHPADVQAEQADHRHRTAGLRAVGYERQAGKR